MNAQTKDMVTKFILHEMGGLGPEDRLTSEDAKDLQSEILSSDEMIISYLQTRQLLEDFALQLHKELTETRMVWQKKDINQYKLAWPIQIVRDRNKNKFVLDMLPIFVKSQIKKKKKELAKNSDSVSSEIDSAPIENSYGVGVSLILPTTPTDMEIKFDIEIATNGIKTSFELSYASQPVVISLIGINGSSSEFIDKVIGTELKDIHLPFNRRYSVNIEEDSIAKFNFLLHFEDITGRII